MATIAENLLKLNDIKEAQKTELSKMFPYMDWNTVPYSMYSKYYKYRNLLDICGELAVNAYNKTNSDIDKDILYDYCCKRHDVGYLFDFTTFYLPSECTVTTNKIVIPSTFSEGNIVGMILFYANKISFKLKVTGLVSGDKIAISTGSGEDKAVYINSDGVVHLNLDNRGKQVEGIFGIGVTRVNPDHEVIIEQLPGYIASNDIYLNSFKFDSTDGYAPHKNALTKSQNTSYGEAALKFALPKDFTVFACRTNYLVTEGFLIAKKDSSNAGEFYFEGNEDYSFSYENREYTALIEEVVSYMTPTSYNRSPITPGNYIGNTESIFYILGTSDIQYNLSGTLYSVVLFNRTLTEEELTVVKDVLQFEYEQKSK